MGGFGGGPARPPVPRSCFSLSLDRCRCGGHWPWARLVLGEPQGWSRDRPRGAHRAESPGDAAPAPAAQLPKPPGTAAALQSRSNRTRLRAPPNPPVTRGGTCPLSRCHRGPRGSSRSRAPRSPPAGQGSAAPALGAAGRRHLRAPPGTSGHLPAPPGTARPAPPQVPGATCLSPRSAGLGAGATGWLRGEDGAGRRRLSIPLRPRRNGRPEPSAKAAGAPRRPGPRRRLPPARDRSAPSAAAKLRGGAAREMKPRRRPDPPGLSEVRDPPGGTGAEDPRGAGVGGGGFGPAGRRRQPEPLPPPLPPPAGAPRPGRPAAAPGAAATREGARRWGN